MSDSQFENLKLWLEAKFEAMDERFDTNDVGHQSIIKRQDIANGSVKRNSEFRLRLEGGWNLLKIMFGTSIVVNIVAIGVAIFEFMQHR